MAEKEIVPKQTFLVTDVIALIVSVVIGTGIFKTPSIIAANTGRTDGCWTACGFSGIDCRSAPFVGGPG